jgi:hypothetical protein
MKRKADVCVFDKRTYKDGDEICDATRFMVCKDGEWNTTWVSSFGP